MAEHNQTGKIGELVAGEFLESKGHKILDRNFSRSYGELDLVSRGKDGKVHFVEVKSVSYGTGLNPEENVHAEKVRRLKRVIESYLSFKKIAGDWQFDVIAVFLDHEKQTAKVRYSENVVLGS